MKNDPKSKTPAVEKIVEPKGQPRRRTAAAEPFSRVVPPPAPPLEDMISPALNARSHRVAAVTGKIRKMRLPYPRQAAVMAEFQETLLTGIEMKGEAQLGTALFDPTGCGKSTAAEMFANAMNAQAPTGETHVVHCRLDNSGTARSLFVNVLAALGDGFANQGTEQRLRMRALDAMEEVGVQLLFIDESQHGGKKSGFGGEITSSIKLLLDCGVVPVAILGTEEAVPIFAKDRELSGRLAAPCSLAPLSWWDDEDRQLWTDFSSALDARLVADGVTSRLVGLDGEGLVEELNEATNGTIGQFMGLIRTAAREMARSGREVITRDDLQYAIDARCIGHGFVSRNPLRKAG